jgi:hypothetical protein
MPRRVGNGAGWGGPKKGEGNHGPGPGRPPGMKPGEGKRARAAELARDHVSDAVEVWRQIMNDPNQPAQARLAAAAHMVDRAEGKAVQPVVDGDDIARMSDAELDAELARMEEAAREAVARAAPPPRAPRSASVVN